MFDLIAFDADDTLWHSECYYREAQDRLVERLTPYGPTQAETLDILHRIEIANLPAFGYGIKGFTISMVEAAVEATDGRVRGEDIRAIVDIGRWMTTHEIRLLDYAEEVVAHLASQRPLMLITKGDLMDQERKISLSGLAPYFKYVEIVTDKTVDTYTTLLFKHGVEPARFLMVGNSMRSDILPVLSLGGAAVLVPYQLTWAHEAEAGSVDDGARFFEILHLGEFLPLLEKLEADGSLKPPA